MNMNINDFCDEIKELGGTYKDKYNLGQLSAVSVSLFRTEFKEKIIIPGRINIRGFLGHKFLTYILGIKNSLEYFNNTFNGNWAYYLFIDDSIIMPKKYIENNDEEDFILEKIKELKSSFINYDFLRVFRVDFFKKSFSNKSIENIKNILLNQNRNYKELFGAFYRMLPLIDFKLRTVALRNSRQIFCTQDAWLSETFLNSDKDIMYLTYDFKTHRNFGNYAMKMDRTIFGGVWNMKIGENSYYLFNLILTDIYNKKFKNFSYGANEVYWTNAISRMEKLKKFNLKNNNIRYNLRKFNNTLYNQVLLAKIIKQLNSSNLSEYLKQIYINYFKFPNFNTCFLNYSSNENCTSINYLVDVLDLNIYRKIIQFIIEYMLKNNIDIITDEALFENGYSVDLHKMITNYPIILEKKYLIDNFNINPILRSRLIYAIKNIKNKIDLQLYIIDNSNKKLLNILHQKNFISELNIQFNNQFNNIQNNLQKKEGLEESINFNCKNVIKGGAKQFIYISKIGRRKLRYTKKGRKYVLIKKKRKYLN